MAAREWEHNFALLEAFRRREGHADVPPGYKVGGTALRVWLDNQRQRCSARVKREDALLQSGLHISAIASGFDTQVWRTSFPLRLVRRLSPLAPTVSCRRRLAALRAPCEAAQPS